MKKLLVAGIAAAALCGAPALAADIPTKAPVYKAAAPMFNWSGFYVGAHGGYMWGELTDFAAGFGFHPKGWFGGGQIGYNWHWTPNWVIGLEADAALADVSINGPATVGGVTGTLTGKVDRFGSVRGRVGYAADRVLFYGTGGYAWGHGKGTGCFVGICVSDNHTHDGWAAGAGIEWAMASHPNLSYKIEYLHYEFESKFYGSYGPAGGKGGASLESVKAGVNYRFDWGKGPVAARY
jgi:outer membrane immunogenic protein